MDIIWKLLHKVSLGILPPRLPDPPLNSHEQWQAYWEIQGQPWRKEPEIDQQRQAELAQRRDIVPDIKQGIYPFSGMQLSRADVEWLLATHEHGRGPVDWNDESQRCREGLDFRGVDLSSNKGQYVNLTNLPLSCLRGGLTFQEWLNATEEQRTISAVHLKNVDLSKADLKGANLLGAHLENACLHDTQLKNAELSEVHLEGADLRRGHLEGARLVRAHLEGAVLKDASLKDANLFRSHLKSANLSRAELCGSSFHEAHLEDANLFGANLENAFLFEAHLERTILREVHLEGANVNNIVLTDYKRVGPQVADIRWGDTNLSVVDWSQVGLLGDEYEAQQKKKNDGNKKGRKQQLNEHKRAVRANRQLTIALQDQGLNEDASHFAYRAQVLQKVVFGLEMLLPGIKLKQRIQALGNWLFSWFLFLLAGYGYKLVRSFLVYLLMIVGFAALYLKIDGRLVWYEAIVVSMTAFHGRGFSPTKFSPGDPLSIASAFEAFVGLIIEVTFIATLTQRFFKK